MRAGHQRPGLRHAVSGCQLNAARLGVFIEAAIERAAADDDFPAAKVGTLRGLGVEQHLQDGRHAMGKGDLLLAPQLHQILRVVAPRINLLEPEHGRHVRQPPGVDVEHRRDRHVHIVGAEQPYAVDRTHDRRHADGVQHQLPMGEIHAFRIARGAGGVERGGHRVFVEVLEIVLRTRSGQQLLVFADKVRQLRGFLREIGQQQGFLHRGQLRRDGLIQPDELAVDQHEAVPGVVHGVEDLLG